MSGTRSPLLWASLLWIAAAGLAAGAALALLSTAGAASDVQIAAIDCAGHPRKVAIQNKGDTAQSLADWKLMSDKPNEVFDLGVVGSVGAGEVFYVYNGHLAPPVPEQIGDQWIYPWNYTEVYDESAFVLAEDGKDFIRLVDATGFPWREVSNMPCQDNTTGIPPLQQPATPTPAPANPDPGAGGDTGQTDGNQATSAQTDGAQSTGASENVPASGNTNTTSGAGTAAQPGNVSSQLAGGPASGAGLLAGNSGTLAVLPLGLLGIVAGAALAFVGVRILHRALRRPL